MHTEINNIQDISFDEIDSVNGGIVGIIVRVVIRAVVKEVVKEFVAGFSEEIQNGE
jgi:hypothetical protein